MGWDGFDVGRFLCSGGEEGIGGLGIRVKKTSPQPLSKKMVRG